MCVLSVNTRNIEVLEVGLNLPSRAIRVLTVVI